MQPVGPRSNRLFSSDAVAKASFAAAIIQKQPIAFAIGCIPFCGEEGTLIIITLRS